uniref:DNA-directed RNA polymerase subunit alpha n=1 Tax=Haplomitrium blumei TaxID=258993 RepID=A0A4Y5P7W7_9MARC|nr:RNA polymerase alpha subunit [Haplomitrium blumei]QCW59365.1 RNA polymerase alpha subunit [Haplomitrium blumei]
MQEELITSTHNLRWGCVESRIESKRLLYGRFAISPFEKGQANTVGIAMRRSLPGGIEGSSITSARFGFGGVEHEYYAIAGVRESIHDILINLKEIILRSDSHEAQKAYISAVGPKKVTAGDVIVPSCVEVIDTAQPTATPNTPISSDIELTIERGRGYCARDFGRNKRDGDFAIDAAFAPTRNANYSIHSFGSENYANEILFVEIWTDGSITPEEALYEASQNLIDSSIPLLHSGEGEKGYDVGDKTSSITPQPFQSISIPVAIEEVTKDVAFRHILIDRLEPPARAYNCLKEVEVHTIADLLDYGEDDLVRIKNLGRKSVEQVLESLKKRFAVNLRG